MIAFVIFYFFMLAIGFAVSLARLANDVIPQPLPRTRKRLVITAVIELVVLVWAGALIANHFSTT